MSIKDLPRSMRPREKLLAMGAAALSDAELLALLLRTGLPGQGVLALADALLLRFGGIAGLLNAQVNDLKAVKGLGPAKRAELAAVLEMARRSLAQGLKQSPVFDSPAQLREYVAMRLRALPHEVFCVLWLDSRHRLIEMQELFQGTLSHAAVHPREVVRSAMRINAAAAVLAHNHPSGVAEPSRADEHLTATLRAALQLVDVRVIDHLVVGASDVVSLADRGLA
jgi:DNA repair protein RadC